MNLIKIIMYILCVSIIISCETEGEKENNQPELITSLISNEANSVEINVKIIGFDGNLINGAIVNVVNPANNLILLECSNGVYKGYFESLISGDYKIIAKVIVSGNSIVLSQDIKHEIIMEKPNITDMRDAKGNSAFSGSNLLNDNLIIVSWLDISHTMYTLSIIGSDKIIYSVNTKDSNYIIPANTLSNGKGYMIYIYSEYLIGDPFFIDSNYLSVSKFTGSSFYFRTE